MANSRFEKLDSKKKDMIIRTALREFSIKDFDEASINQISKKAGLSAGNLYYYFENKEDLYITVASYVIDIFKKELGNFSYDLEKYPFWDCVKIWVIRRLKISLSDKDIGYFINKLFEYDLSKDISDVELKFKEHIRNTFKEIFDIGIKNGAIRDDLPIDYLFNMHLSMVLSTNQWIATNWDQFESSGIDSKKLDDFINASINLIKSAMQATKID